VLFNGMIHPLAPYGLKGVLWYQGENNANDRRADQYPAVFTAMVQSWRALFRQPELPFLWVQLPNYKTDKDWAQLREAQEDALAVPHTGQVVTIDIGDPKDIHPHNKIEVAHRLARLALGKVYGRAVVCAGPRFVSAKRDGDGLRVTFAEAEGGLVARGGAVNDLELAGADHVFHPAQGRIDGQTLLVTSPQVAEPKAVRYAWSNNPSANLYNRAGLPAGPFRSERW
jgi:sialate O-acetylesterase